MTKVKPNNAKETKSNIFPWDIFKSDIIFDQLQNTKIFYVNDFIIGTFQFYCKSEHKQV